MGLYLGSSKKQKIKLSDGSTFRFNLYSSSPITNGVRLLTSDGYILKDYNGLYLTAKEDK